MEHQGRCFGKREDEVGWLMSVLTWGGRGGWPGRALGCGPGRLERTVQIMGGRQGGTVGIRNMGNRGM